MISVVTVCTRHKLLFMTHWLYALHRLSFDVVLLGCTERVAYSHVTGEGSTVASRWQRQKYIKGNISY